MAALVAWPDRPTVTFAVGTRGDGDARLDSPSWRATAARCHVGDWSMLTEEHGTEVRVVTRAGEHCGGSGDALVTSSPSSPIGVWVGDCAPIGLVGEESVGVVHAGWRGLEAGVLERAADVLGGVRGALIGPHIRTCCYEFGTPDLDRQARRFGDVVRGRTRDGRPAFDVNAAIRVILGRLGVATIIDAQLCTGCRADLFYSHRVRGDHQRHLFGAWIEGRGR